MDGKENLETMFEHSEHVLLRKLFHLKSYETPDTARMTRNRQNIIRKVREANGRTHWNLSDLLEVNIPWFFAEPKYGIAILFVAFVGLQYLGVNGRDVSQSQTGIYTTPDTLASFEQQAPASTNRTFYPKLPDSLALFPDQQGDDGIKFVGRIEAKK